MSTNLIEFIKRLGADPREREPEHRLDQPPGAEFDEARREAAAFEDKLETALKVTPPADLVDDLVGIAAQPAAPRRAWMAIAASLVVAVGAAGILWNQAQEQEEPLSLDEHVAWHFEMDGHRVLELADPDFDLAAAREILAQFDFTADAEMESQIRFVKICPGFDGNSAHLVVQTETGLVSIFIMPGVRTEEHLVEFDGMQAYLVGLRGATAAIVGRTEQGVSAYRDMVRNALTRLS